MPMPMVVESYKSTSAKLALKIEIQKKNEIRKQLIGKFTNEDEILESLTSLIEIPEMKNITEDLNDLKERYSKLRIINEEIGDLKRKLTRLEKEDSFEKLQNRNFLCLQQIKHWKKVLDVSMEQEGEVDLWIKHYAKYLESKATEDETGRKDCLTAITLLTELKKSDQEQNALAATIKKEEKIRAIEIQKDPIEEELSALRKNIFELCDELGIFRYDEIPKEIEEFSEILRTTNSQSLKINCEQNLSHLANLQKLLKKEKELLMKLASFDKKSEECKIEEEIDVELKKDEEDLKKLEISITSSLQKFGIKTENDLLAEIKNAERLLKTFEKILIDMRLIVQLIEQRKKLKESLEQKKKKSGDSELIHKESETFKIDIQVLVNEEEQQRKAEELDLELLKIDLDELPECGERTLVILQSKLIEKGFLNSDEEIPYGEMLAKMKKQFVDENLMNFVVEEYLEKIKVCLVYSQFIKAKSFLKDMRKKHITLLNITELKSLVHKTKSAEERIENQDIVIIVGPSGAGKSTIILYLYGKKMVKKSVIIMSANNEQLQMMTIDGDTPLQGVKSSPQMKSETRFLHVVELDLARILKDQLEDRKIFISDSPGFGDTAGAEVDISNALGVVNAIQKAKSVKVILTVSGLGENGAEFKKLLKALIGIIPNVEDIIESFLIIFNKFTPDQAKNIPALITNFSDHQLSPAEKDDPDMKVLLKKIKISAKDENNFINLFNEKPEIILFKIIKLPPIRKPKDAFKFSISNDSRSTLNDQINLFTNNILNSYQRKDFPLVKYYLDRMLFLNTILEEEFIKRKYNDCVKFLGEHMRHEFESEIELLNRCFLLENNLKKEDLEKYKTTINSAEKFNDFRKTHLNDFGLDIEMFETNISKQLDILDSRLKSNNLEDAINGKILEKMHLTVSEFPEYVSLMTKSLDGLKKKMMVLRDKIEKIMAEFNMEQFGHEMNIMLMIKINLQKFLNYEDYDKVKDRFLKNVDILLIERVDKFLLSEKISEKDMEILSSQIKQMESIKGNLDIQKHIPYSEIIKKADILMNSLTKYFNKTKENLYEMLKVDGDGDRETFLKKFQIVLKRMTEIKALSPTISYALSDTYYAIIAYLKSSFDRINNSIRELLNDIQEQKNLKSNFKEIAVNLMILRNSLWIQEEGYLENIFEYKVNKIESDIMIFVETIYESLRDVHFDFSRKEEIMEIHSNYKILTQLDILGDDRLLPEIRIKFKEIKESIQKSIEIEVNDKIKILCPKDFDKVSIASLDAALEYLKQINRKDYAPFHGWTLQSYEALRKYLQNYKNHLVESFNKGLKFLNLCTFGINENNPDEFEKIKMEIDRLRNILIKYEDFQVFKNYSDLDVKVIFQEFEKFLREISLEMTQLNIAGRNEKLYDKILLCSYLSVLDYFLDSNQPLNFQSLYEKFAQLFNQKLSKFEQAAYNAIDKKHYLDLVAIFNDVKDSGDPQKHKVLENLIHRLEIALEKDAVEMLSLAKNLIMVDTEGNYRSSLDSVKKIAALKYSLMKASQETKELLMSEKSQEKMKNAINEIHYNLEGNILECYNQIEKKYLNLSNFSKFEDLFMKCENIFNAIDMKYQYKEIIEKRTDIQTKRINKITEIENKYKIFTFDSHAQSKDIAKDLDNLISSGETSAEYNSVATQIENNLQAQLLEKITKIKNEAQDLVDVDTSLEKTKRHIQSYFSQNAFQIALLGDIETALDNNRRNKQEKETKLDQILQNKDYNSIITFFKDNTSRALKTKATETIAKQFEKDLMKILTNLETDIEQSIQSIFETHESITQLRGVFPNETKKITDQIKNAANNIINQKIAAASAIFTKKAESPNQLGSNATKESKKIITLDTEEAKKSFKVIFDTAQCIEKDTTNVVSNYFENFKAKTDNLFNNMFLTYQKNCALFQTINTFEDFQMQQVSVALASATTWDKILSFIYMEYENFLLGCKNEFLMKLKNLYLTEGVTVQVESLRTLTEKIVKELSEGHNNQRQFYTQQEAYNFYNTRKKKKDFIIACNSFLKSYLGDLGKDIININKAEKENIKLLATCIHDILDKNDLDQNMCINLNKNLQTLIVIEKNSGMGGKQLRQIKDKIMARIQTIKNAIDDKNRKANLIQIKSISESIDVDDVRKKLNLEIDDILDKHKKSMGVNGLKILGFELNQDDIGQKIIAEHKIFIGFSLSLFNQRMPKYDLDKVLEDLQGDQINKKKLKQKYEEFQKLNKKLITKYLRKEDDGSVKELVQELKNLTKSCGNNGVLGAFKVWEIGKQNEQEKKINWTRNIKDSIQDFMAYIFALWTVMNAPNIFELDDDKKESYLCIPYPIQILSILRIFGCGDDNNSLQNNLVQIGTGEGKSLIIAVTSTIFALLGFDVSCVCYNEYLSTRDFESFQALFDILEITPFIYYGKLREICERTINEKGDIGKSVSDLITTGKNEIQNKMEDAKSKPKIMLLDEVDTLFGKDIYGELYILKANLKDVTIDKLLEYVWREKSNINLNNLLASIEFKNVVNRFKDWKSIMEEQAKCMIADVQNFQDHHDYLVDKNKIGYRERNKIISFNIVVGYKTLFAYMHEIEKGTITKSKAYTNLLVIAIECGKFSYAKIILKPSFDFIMGVSGNLNILNDRVKKVLNDEYLIKKITYLPSVFGFKALSWNEEKDVNILGEKDYFNGIALEIQQRLNGNYPEKNRAIIVVFDDKKKLQDFYESQIFAHLKKITNILTEELASSEKLRIIKTATFSNRITLITKSFVRGTDFICQDERVRSQGGVHVLQVFFSTELSEEVQIMGRTAHQGDLGSFSMVLLDTDLSPFLIPKEEFFDPHTGEKGKFFDKENKEMYYKTLNKKRNEINSDDFMNNKQLIENSQMLHMEAKTFMEKGMIGNDLQTIREFLLKWNKGPIFNDFRLKTLVLMDGTGSMTQLLEKCKSAVFSIFERTSILLEEHFIDPSCIYLQFAVYRNYNTTDEQFILENSNFENNSFNLLSFLSQLKAKDGLGFVPETKAIEIGLWHANRVGVSQVILIGDAPPNSKDKIDSLRANYYGENYWGETIFAEKTYYKKELEKLKKNNIKVHGFYVHEDAKKNFMKIANYTGGDSDFLDVNGTDGETLLTNFITLKILKIVEEQKGLEANLLLDSYKKKYCLNKSKDCFNLKTESMEI